MKLSLGPFAFALLPCIALAACGGEDATDDDGGGAPLADASADAKATNGKGDAGKDSGSPPSKNDASTPPTKDASVPDAADPWLDPTRPGWTLVWHDEFDGNAGAHADNAKWTFETGSGGWGNQELEYYTDRTDNARLDGNGKLIIQANREDFGDSAFTSARLKTEGKFSQTYGRFEARALLPPGRGLWPAFWLLANNHNSIGWPDCGEIDVMEQMGSEPASIRGSLNGPGYSGASAVFATYGLPAGKTFASDYHVFVIEWSPGAINYYVDDELYSKRVPASLPNGTSWVFDGHPFFILLNLAVGGNLPGDPDGTTPFPARMLVDFVRVYKKAT